MIHSGAAWLCTLLDITIPLSFSHTAPRIIFAACTSLLISVILGPPFLHLLTRLNINQPIRDDEGFLLADLHKNKQHTPTLGGALLVCSILFSTIFWADWSSFFIPILVSSMLFFGTLGAIDDWMKLRYANSKGLKGKIRFILQTLFAFGIIFLLTKPELLFSKPHLLQHNRTLEWNAWMSATFLPFLQNPLFIASGVAWVFIWFIQWLTIVGTANAVNLTDGLDGLATGCICLVALPLTLFAFLSNHQEFSSQYSLVYIESSGEIAVMLSALIGAAIGFLWFNAYPALVFMGDTGSLAIGGLVGTAAVLMKQEWFLAMVGAIFVVETLSVILQVLSFKHRRKRIFRCAPLHHHFEYVGIPEPKVVVRFWIIGILLATLGIISIVTR